MVRKVMILSDSHGKSQNIKSAIDREIPDMLIHLGDVEDDTEMIRGWLDDAARKYNAESESDAESHSRISLPVPAVFIQGNCDTYYGDNLKKIAVFELRGHRFFCTHGHRQGVSQGPQNLMYSAVENDCDIALYGHTHVPFDDTFESFGSEVRIINPGSISLPRGGSSKSYVMMTFSDDGSDEYEVEFKTL